MSRYDEQDLRRILTSVRAPESVARWRTRTAAPEEAGIDTDLGGPTSAGRGWRLPVALATAAATVMIGAIVGVQLLSDDRQPIQPGPGPSTSASNSPASPTASPSALPPASRTASPPAATGGPPASGVGIPAGTSLAVHNGDLHVGTAGATVRDLIVNGTLLIDAPNVTVERVRVQPGAAYFGITQADNATNLTVRDSEIIGTKGQKVEYGIAQSTTGLTIIRTLIRRVQLGVSAGAGGLRIIDSRIDEMTGPSPVGVASHGETPGLTIQDSAIINTSDTGSAIALMVDSGPQTDVLISGNTLAGGAFAIHGGRVPGSRDVRVRSNGFSRAVWPKCGAEGVVRDWDFSGPGNEWTGNVWADTGAAVEP